MTRHHYLACVTAVTEASEDYFSIIAHLVAPGDCVLDVGGNIGMYAKFLSGLVGPAGKVLSVEPLPRNIAILEYVRRALHLDNVSIVRCALSDRDGRAELSIPTYESGVENYYRPCLGGTGGGRKVWVATRRIDSLLAGQTQRVSFIKIDVEGHEWPCIQGALVSLRRDRPALLIEVNGDPDNPLAAAAELFKILTETGYCAYVWEEHQVRPRVAREQASDYFFLMEEHLAFLNKRGLTRPAPVPVEKARPAAGDRECALS